MAKKIGKTIQDAKARVQKTRAEYKRALFAYNKWLTSELSVIPRDTSIEKLAVHFPNLKGKKRK